MTIHYAPWSGRFKTLCCAGAKAYEVQVGPLVLQWFYEPYAHARLFRRLHVWRDRLWRVVGARGACRRGGWWGRWWLRWRRAAAARDLEDAAVLPTH